MLRFARCVDTARLAFPDGFDATGAWASLGSPRGASEETNEASLRALRQALAQRASDGGFEVWVTHQFVLTALAGGSTASGEGLVLRAGSVDAPVHLLARLAIG